LSDLYADFLPAFSSAWLNVDCDETWDLGTGQSKELSERLGKGRVYLQHIQVCASSLQRTPERRKRDAAEGLGGLRAL
jgi:hypothetical protein